VVGENKVQEILRKYDAIPDDVQWHLIGHLQTNKVRQILDHVALIHSVDSVHLASEIQKRAEKSGRIVDSLIEVNVAQEESKHGLKLGDVEPLLREIEAMKNIRICGLMTVAPFTDDPEDVRIYFKELKQLFDHLKGVKLENVKMEILSMGMTNDFEVAIEEGATLIRVGTGIFGERDYHQ
jgi:PLP dependent protein